MVGAVQRQTEEYLHQWWADRFTIERPAVWASVSARPHGMLGDYPGFFVAWRDTGVHVSLPAGVDPGVERELAGHAVKDLQQPEFWHDFAAVRGLEVIGPSTHLYLDVDPGGGAGVTTPTEDELASLRARTGDDDWRESGFADAPVDRTFGLHHDGVLVAASNLNLFDGKPRDIGVLVAPEARGRGLAPVVARHAASYAVREHGLARWGARDTNVASLATARRLGFEPFCTQLAMR
jgi:RimJ/RimL family protein N-acetyltransferase